MRLRLVARLVAGVLIAVAACGGGGHDMTAEGVVIDVSGNLTSVEGFTIRTSDGSDLQFTPDADVRFHGVGPLGHLRNHLTSGVPIVVVYETADDDSLIALAVDDR